MTEWFPSLNALRAFEAVCRHLNFARAADELRVTPAAVKQLVDKLEVAVGHPLVQRSGRGLALTAAGASGRGDLAEAFAQLQRAVERMRRHSDRQRLIVSVEPTFATAWLVPRLERFRRENPGIDVLIDSSLKMVDLEHGDADVALRFGAKAEASLIVHRLFDERLGALCSPSMLGASKCLQNVEDLAHCTLLHWDMSELSPDSATRRWMSWQGWLKRAGAKQFDHHDGITFSDYNLLVQSAVAGHGVMVGSLPVLSGLISTGLLANPMGKTVDTDVGYDVVTTPQALERSEVKSFVKWILEESLYAADGELQTSGGSVVCDRATI